MPVCSMSSVVTPPRNWRLPPIFSQARYLGVGSFWIKDGLKPLHDAHGFYVRSVIWLENRICGKHPDVRG
ncbi:hypothetical protein KCP69_19040 [Salmonella enterica subsp. enterica]|nr:hypothetical protein KCP69_19040 [Salmonella enterica subsp. enterica]